MAKQHYVEVIFNRQDDLSMGRNIYGPYTTDVEANMEANNYNYAGTERYGEGYRLLARAIVIEDQ